MRETRNKFTPASRLEAFVYLKVVDVTLLARLAVSRLEAPKAHPFSTRFLSASAIADTIFWDLR